MTEPTSGLAAYQSIKRVLAGEITEVTVAGCYVREADGTTVLRTYAPKMTERYQPVSGDYWVVYPGSDGYQSISPKAAFEDGYFRITVEDQPKAAAKAATVLITHKEIIGQMANWAVRQHPFGRPDGLFDVTDAITEAAQEWPEGIQSLKMMRVDGPAPIEAWLRSALQDNPILAQWNTPKSGHTGSVFVSRYSGPRPEDDFIDIDALLRNVALSAWRSACEEAALGS